MSRLENIVKEYLDKFAIDFSDEVLKNIPDDYRVKKTIEVYVDGYKVIFKAADYFIYIENGRRAGAKPPPSSAILEWIQVKKIVPRGYGGNKPPTQKQLSYIIARSIGIKGIKPKHYLKNAKEKNLFNKSELGEALEAELYKMYEEVGLNNANLKMLKSGQSNLK